MTGPNPETMPDWPAGPDGPVPPRPGSEPGDRLPDGGGHRGTGPGGPEHRGHERPDHRGPGGQDRRGPAGPGGTSDQAARGPGGDEQNRDEAPQEIRESFTLWIVAAVLAMFGTLLTVATTRITDLPQATRDVLDEASANVGHDATDAAFGLAMVLGGIFAVLLCALTVWLASRLRAGKRWARTVLTFAAVFLVVEGITTLLSVFTGSPVAQARNEVLTFLVFALQILAGLCAGVAAWRMYTPEATEYLAPIRPEAKGPDAGQR